MSDWDGVDSTPLAVPVKTQWRQNYAILQARSTMSSVVRQVLNISHGKKPTPFNDRFNNWLEKERGE